MIESIILLSLGIIGAIFIFWLVGRIVEENANKDKYYIETQESTAEKTIDSTIVG